MAGRDSFGGTQVAPPNNQDVAATLSELGVTKKQSSRWQKLAAVDEEKFEAAVAAAKEVAGEVTSASILAGRLQDAILLAVPHRYRQKTTGQLSPMFSVRMVGVAPVL